MKCRVLVGLVIVIAAAGQDIRLTRVAGGIAAPTDIENAADGSGRLFLVQQNGIVKILRNGSILPQPFLDITSKTAANGERGLLGIAFPPGFANSGRFYADYTDSNGDTTISMFRANGDVADAGSETVLMKIQQPFANHNGGQLRFGPDGYLYIGMGDGGNGGDPLGNGQNRNVLLGKLLRVDVESKPGQVVIPLDNPFVAMANPLASRGEIWAWGLRNPWRFSFDRATGDLWIADVGQGAWEEVDFQPASSHGGENYGWNLMEGMHCFLPGCSKAGLTLPVLEYPHTVGCSITGGFVYRGSESPGLRGLYLYGDYCSGRIWSLERTGLTWSNRLLLESGLGITTFGQDESGESYVADANGSAVYRIQGNLSPRVSSTGVVNAASYAAGVVPGSLATVFAAGVLDTPGIVTASAIPLPVSLSGVSVTMDGITAPLTAIANSNGLEQVNLQVPFELAGKSTVSVVVTRNDQSSAAVSVPVWTVQPGVYAVAVHNSDYSLVTDSKPLVFGEYAFLYAEGLGAVQNQPATGAAAPSSPLASTKADVRVTLGGVACDVQYAGLAPGFAGVYQVNFRVAAGVGPGPAGLVVSAGGVDSPAVRFPVQ